MCTCRYKTFVQAYYTCSGALVHLYSTCVYCISTTLILYSPTGKPCSSLLTRLLATDFGVQRLRLELSFLEQCRVLVCRYIRLLYTVHCTLSGGAASSWVTRARSSLCPRRGRRGLSSTPGDMCTRLSPYTSKAALICAVLYTREINF